MKRYAYLILFSLVILGCTDSQQQEKIRSFWTEQIRHLLPPSMRPLEQPPLPVEQLVEMQRRMSAQQSAVAPDQAAVVLLFGHPQAPDYVRLQKEEFVEKFKERHAGKINLYQYDVSTPAGQAAMQGFMQLGKLPHLTVPALVIGPVILQYPFEGADQALQQAFTPPVVKKPLASQRRVKRPVETYQFMEITMEDEPSKIAKTNTKVSAKDRVHIQRALEGARLANQKTLKDIGQAFGPETQAQAFAIIARAEKVLQTSALSSESAQKYLDVQEKVLKQQDQLLNKLMQNSVRNLRPIRG